MRCTKNLTLLALLTVSRVLIANVPSTTPSISSDDAISKAESELGAKYNQHPTKLEFVAKQDGSVALTHVVQVRDDSKAMWYEAFVDAHTGDIIQLTDFVSHASVGVVFWRDRAKERTLTTT